MFEATGNILVNNKTLVDIGIKGKELDIQSALLLIPDKYKKNINAYESEGEFYFNAKIKGGISDGKMPRVNANFGINDANITHRENNIILQKVNLKGSFTNGKNCDAQSCVLTLNSFNASLNKGLINGELTIKDFNNLFIDSKIKANIALEELQNFAKFDTIETISGQLKLDVALNGKWDEISFISTDKTTTTGSLVLEDMGLKIKNYALAFTKINGDFNFDNNSLIVNNFSGNADNSDFQIEGVFKNIISYLFKKNQQLVVEATLNSKNIDLNQLLENKNKEENKSSESVYKLYFSEHVDLNLNSTINHLFFRKFEATNIKGLVKLKDKKMIVDSILFSTMNGSVATTGVIDGSDPSKLLINCFSEVKNIDITKMFIAFENFGQTNITNKNIKGIATANIQFKAPISDELKVDMDNIYANIDMTIDKGELNNVESMKSLSKFIALQELMNMKFSTLKNQIEIKNQTLLFPK